MQIKTIKGAMSTAEKLIKKIFMEEIKNKSEINRNTGILQTRYSIFLIQYIKEKGTEFKKYFPEISKQIMWDEGIKISKKIVIEFINYPNIERKKLSIVFVLSDGEMFQISPISLMNFCEIANLEVEDNGVYYFFPTIFLKKIKGETTKKEINIIDKLSLISQINSLENFDEEDLEYAATFKDFDVDLFGEITRTLRNIEKHLEEIEKYLKRDK
ncbi:MAG: hypothetical protein COS15_05350 [Caldiserica bacterium CG02_land_8_20_14_3_00_36_38]|jgi:hypothetical protein|nr:hypothetical protein [Caldisericota bacterium]OIP12288.1 MAG: hypothetical protein AUJ99_05220 [Caldisericum sp. CG2_30_36_11]PIP49979.1 MAG: hypothetical protein COX13_00910 [Caldiserica bacterium CG23_combo_of_CG06-09_8_20_14_all_35_60]PIV54609.1 MAG: hypothetical protein COS15_05350 [Caldiserica bacterium CG02_land_8_20_14_3_00_36_38]PIW11131.1 MAG: hypothetical protein COW37_00195 [Caldiserica bacterium CG17_big_fil_post_rev_8_21_14_2_50_35_7]PIX29559.1 MAG: hypothetical protein COZ65_0